VASALTCAAVIGVPHHGQRWIWSTVSRCEPYSFALNRRFVDEVVLVTDDQIRDGMRLLFRSAKLAVEPAGAAALAALMYPLRARLEGKRVGVVVCGANIDAQSFASFLLP